MVKLISCVFFFFALVTFFYSTEISCREVEDEHDFSYIPGSPDGPENWGDIHPEWADCKNGTMQSPIDLSDDRVEIGTHLRTLNTNYTASNATIMNRGHDVMLKWVDGGGTIQINDTEYVLLQAHWHSPSEHTFNGTRFALELHLVHEAMDNKTAVIGVTYTYGDPDTFLTQVLGNLETMNSTDSQETAVGVLDPNDIEIGCGKYYRYIGSLTTPPCTENVTWTMVEKVMTVSTEQVRLLRDAVSDDSETNARPVQELNDRPVYLYEPQDTAEN